MAFTMHSHSGQFCPGHAKDQLEDIVRHAIRIGFKTMALTEHMPRTELIDLYPEEMDPSPQASLDALMPRHLAFLSEAQRLQEKYASQIHILIGFEGEWPRPEFGPFIRELYISEPCVDFVIGSLHHAAGVPIDFDKAMYLQAARAAAAAFSEKSSSSSPDALSKEEEEETLWNRYYDEQFDMLSSLRPVVVGHFDLIRLMSGDPARDVRTQWPGTWERIVRNLGVIRGYGGWLECNTSALRKGLTEPYPGRAIATEWIKMGGKFTFSDDSHGIAQVATNYLRGLDYLESLGVTELWTFRRRPVHPGTTTTTPTPGDGEDRRKAELDEVAVPLAEFRASLRLGGDAVQM
ncbi:Polymerase/histidinol phosphatase-like protein [Echria macrotheca]|uniref:Histidinol-phosphatase n=1 Tax=Echria macrotheca TaxID=438768 RepID=A0AAJ0B5N8_9PEZI|nr:Polymerase/histidinol phosphatase-like protein [Echria macrotheca]